MNTNQLKTQRFSVYLVKENTIVDESVFSENPILSESVGNYGTLHVFNSQSNPPRWLSLFSALTQNNDILVLRNMTNSAVFHYKSNGRDLLITFGYAKSKIDLTKTEDDFGIRTCLNLIDEHNIREVERQSLSNNASKKKEQSLGNTDINDFEIEEESDLLRSITGKPNMEAFGKRVGGTQALSIYGQIDIPGLINLSPELLTKYREESYKKHFGWIDKVKKIINKTEIERLDSLLIQDFPKRDTGVHLWAGIPDIIEWTTFDGFSFRNNIDFNSQSEELFDDPSIDSFLQYFNLQEYELTIDKLKTKRIYAYIEMQANSNWSFYQCLYYERKEADKLFILNTGNWYVVEDSFYDALRIETNKYIPSAPSSYLIECNKAKECEYNKELSIAIAGHFFDDVDIIPYGGRNNIEVCDVYKPFEFYHIKIYGGAPVLSHLFNQGVVSTSLVRGDSIFRKAVIVKLPSNIDFPGKDSIPQDQKFKVIFGIITKHPNNFELPLFSRITLKNAFRTIITMGCEPKIELIEQKYVKNPRKTRKKTSKNVI